LNENSKDDRSNYLKLQHKILAGKQQHKIFQLRNPDGTAQLQQAQQFQDNTITATSGLHCNRMLHIMVQSVFVLFFLSPFGSNKETNSVQEVFVIPI
jgi:hypothetical protein